MSHHHGAVPFDPITDSPPQHYSSRVGLGEGRGGIVPARALQVSGVLEMSSREPMDSECSAEGLLRGGGKGEISVVFVSWASVSRSRRRLRLLLGVLRERRDSAFFMAGLSF